MRRALLSTLLFSFVTGCVTQAEHERALADAAARLRGAQQQHAQQLQAAQAQITTLETTRAKLERDIAARDKQIKDEQARASNLQSKLDEATALNQQLSGELKKAGKNVGKLLAEKGKIAKALVASKKRLEELRKAQALAQKRAALFRSLALKFKKMIDSGDLKILLRDGRMVLQLQNDVLFDAGRTTIKSEGKKALENVAAVLVTLTDRKLQVAGHTDNDKIGTARFPSNWELSAARAIGVVKFLVAKGVKAELLSAAGYSKFDPVAANDSDEGKAKNRRIEIVLQPNIGELVQVPGSG